MSGKLIGQVYALDLPRTEREVLIAVCNHANDDGTDAYPSAGLLAWELDLSERHVRRQLEALEAKGLLKVVAYANGGRGKATEYEVHLENGNLKAPRSNGKNPDTRMSAFNKEGDNKTRTFSPQKADISDEKADILELKADIQMSYQQGTVNIEPSINSLTVREAEKPIRAVPKSQSARGPVLIPPPPNRPHAFSARLFDETGITAWAVHEAQVHDVELDVPLTLKKFANWFSKGGRGATERMTDEEWESRLQRWVFDEIERQPKKGSNGNGLHKRQGLQRGNKPANRSAAETGEYTIKPGFDVQGFKAG